MANLSEEAYNLNMRVGHKTIQSQFLLKENMWDQVTIGVDCLEMLGYELVVIR